MKTENTLNPNTIPLENSSWQLTGLHPDLLELIQKAGFERPTLVQSKAIPLALNGSDLMVSAQTGTGKTAAFVLPLVMKLKNREGTLALVLAPSREIAIQTQAVFETFGAPLGVRSVTLIGGVDMKIDKKALDTYPQVIVATPGRLCDHIDRGNLWLNYLEALVLDEADRMLDMGFSEQVNQILKNTPSTRQTLLFSATFSKSVEVLARRILKKPHRLQVGKALSPAETVDQHFLFMDAPSKLRALKKVIQEEPGTVFIFTRSKDRATNLWRALRSHGFYDATHLHSNLRQRDREQALEDFKSGKYRVMIATDVIGRGIHVHGVALVVNFDLPRDAEDYVHRIGRTGRADLRGKAISFVTPQDRVDLRKIERLLGHAIRGEKF